MSVSPLPVAPPVNPTPAPGNVAQPAGHQGSTAFNTHLQSAQRQQTSSSSDADTAQDDNSQGSGNDPATTGAQASAPAKPGAAQPGTSAAQTSSADSSDSDAISIPTSLGSLASTVLNLIGQATGDAESNDTPASGGKSTNGDKSSTSNNTTPSTNTAQAQPATAQTPVVVPMPLPPPVVPAATAATSKGNTSSDSSVSALDSNSNTVAGNQAAPSTSGQKKAPGTNTGVDDADDSGSGDTSTVGATGDSAASLQAAADGAQALASTPLSSSHVAPTTTALPSANAVSTNTPDLTALRGMVDATAVAAPSSTSATPAHGLSVDAPVGSSGFAKELGQQVTWLSGQDVKQAQIRLNPQDLGPLDVKVSIDHGRVDVAFMTQHPETAAAVQQGLGQLHQMLGGQGLSLGHTTVGQQSAQQQFADQQQQQANGQATSDAEGAVESTAAETLQRVAVGLVDAFA